MNKVSNFVRAQQAWASQDLQEIEKATESPQDRIQFEKWLAEDNRFANASDRHFQADVLRVLQGRVSKRRAGTEDEHLVKLAAAITGREEKGWVATITTALGINSYFEPDMVALAHQAKQQGLKATSEVLMGGTVDPTDTDYLLHSSDRVSNRNLQEILQKISNSYYKERTLELCEVAPSWMLAQVVEHNTELAFDLSRMDSFEVLSAIGKQLEPRDVERVAKTAGGPKSLAYIIHGMIHEGDNKEAVALLKALPPAQRADVLKRQTWNWPIMTRIMNVTRQETALELMSGMTQSQLDGIVRECRLAQRNPFNIFAQAFQETPKILAYIQKEGPTLLKQTVEGVGRELRAIAREAQDRADRRDGS